MAALGAPLPAAAWPRCRPPSAAPLLAAPPPPSWPWVRPLLPSLSAPPAAASVVAPSARVLAALPAPLPAVAAPLAPARPALLAFPAFPPPLWRPLWSPPPPARLPRAVRRRPAVVGLFPARASLLRLVGAVLAAPPAAAPWLALRAAGGLP
ncbi:hypothetical protein C3R44_22440 [Mycobacterium tuberculosis]|uniref:transposase n=1 Tax=Mycobacterium tuberculosis TaxID=1773 RepID=UPI000E22B6EF|nr:hypothetical protein C3R44_22440 [Mycobacterium tuberculosis]